MLFERAAILHFQIIYTVEILISVSVNRSIFFDKLLSTLWDI